MEKKKNILERDIFTLPPFGWWGKAWRAPFANLSVRREAKALLFTELSEALRQNAPLDQALLFSSREPTLTERRKRGILRSFFDHVIALTIVWSVGLLYLIFSPRYMNAGRVARLLARRLHDQVVRGRQLSEAMKLCRPDFDEKEIALVEIGEKSGTLPQTLHRLVRFQASEDYFFHQQAKLAYPLLVFLVGVVIASFILIKIVPKFTDIFLQLGASELPPVTQAVIDLFDLLTHGYLLPLVVIFIFFLIWQLLMNGSAVTRRVMAWVIAINGLFIVLRIAMECGPPGAYIAAVVLAAVVVLLPYVLSTIEFRLVQLEEGIRSLLMRGPKWFNPMRLELEARFLAALSIMLESGLPAHEAVRMAGRTAGAGLSRRAEKAGGLIEAGNSIGESIVRANLLSKETNHQLAFIEGRGEYTERLDVISQELSIEAREHMTRWGWGMEVLAVSLCGAFGLLLALAFYMPLFNVPKVLLGLE